MNYMLPDAPDKIWARGGYDIMSGILRDIAYNAELSGLPPDFQYQTFLRIFLPLICKQISSSPPGKYEGVPWSTNPPRVLLVNTIIYGPNTRCVDVFMGEIAQSLNLHGSDY